MPSLHNGRPRLCMISAALTVALLGATYCLGCFRGRDRTSAQPVSSQGVVTTVSQASTAAAEGAMPRAPFARFYKPVTATVTPRAPQYPLPLANNTVGNYDAVKGALASPGAADLFRRNGFVVVPWGYPEDNIVSFYESVDHHDWPVLITSDSVLHLYHMQFDELLRGVEERQFVRDLTQLSEAMLGDARSGHDRSEGMVQEAYGANAAYFAVGLSLLTGRPDVPGWAREKVDSELGKIEAHAGFARSDLFGYDEDYSQYVPRGHYTRSEALQRYFRAMMWYGRLAFVASAKIVPPEVAQRQTMQAALIAEALNRVSVGNRTAADVWGRLYDVTAFFVGMADDLTPAAYREALAKAMARVDAESVREEACYNDLRRELAKLRGPAIYGGTGNVVIMPGPDGRFTPEQLDEVLEATKGMRFMGQRFILDGYIGGRLVMPVVGSFAGQGQPFTLGQTLNGPQRVFARGLDIMGVLGFSNAGAILEKEGDTSYERYAETVADLRQQVSGLKPDDWHQNLYWAWMDALTALAAKPGAGYPSCMQTPAWQDKQLNAALGSWAQLRHDTILYAKQPYTPMAGAAAPMQQPPPGFVEPVPELWGRLQSLTRMTKAGLQDASLLSEEDGQRLDRVDGVLSQLLAISVKELQAEELTKDETDFIRYAGAALEDACAGMESEAMKTALVADVHTDTNTGQVLEEGTGNLMLLVAALPTAQGNVFAACGPVFSVYEFKHPMADRLTDEAWRDMLGKRPPALPAWTSGYRAGEAATAQGGR